jgi:hypothetical protein
VKHLVVSFVLQIVGYIVPPISAALDGLIESTTKICTSIVFEDLIAVWNGKCISLSLMPAVLANHLTLPYHIFLVIKIFNRSSAAHLNRPFKEDPKGDLPRHALNQTMVKAERLATQIRTLEARFFAHTGIRVIWISHLRRAGIRESIELQKRTGGDIHSHFVP